MPLAARPGEVLREDYEYIRNGVANVFMFFAPLEGKRHVKVTEFTTADARIKLIRLYPSMDA